MNSIEILTQEDIGDLNELLEKSQLPQVETLLSSDRYFKISEMDAVCGAIGLEVYGNYGLLRSMVVRENCRNLGFAARLVQRVMEEAKNLGLKRLVLLTTTADRYFDRLGFARIKRDDVPAEIKQSQEFASICPVSAIVMEKEL